MELHVQNTAELKGIVVVPSSKSQSIRALLLATLASGKSVLTNVLDSADTKVAKEVCKLLGADLIENDNVVEIESIGLPLNVINQEINTGDSGVTTRLILPMLGLRNNSEIPVILDCGEQMRKRPIVSLIQALNNLGMNIQSVNNDGCCPLKITGSLIGGEAEVAGLTSQFVSALLLSLPCAELDSKVEVKDLHERPYVEMTLEWLKGQDIEISHYQKDNTDFFEIKGGQKYHCFNKQIPADFSSLSYPLAAAVIIPGEVKLSGIDMQDVQGDKKLISILQEMGADIQIKDSELIVKGGKKLQGIEIDANDLPDMVPTLAVIGAYAEGETRIVNVPQARLKETDRIKSMAEGLKKMGAKVEEMSEGLVVNKSNLRGAKVEGYSDHRTIMALAVAGLIANGETIISTAEGISKTFPNFVELMNQLGAKIKIIK